MLTSGFEPTSRTSGVRHSDAALTAAGGGGQADLRYRAPAHQGSNINSRFLRLRANCLVRRGGPDIAACMYLQDDEGHVVVLCLAIHKN